MRLTLSFGEFAACLQSQWFDEDWPPLLQSSFMTRLGHLLFEGDMETYHNDLARMLSACFMPQSGLTMFKANCNFDTLHFQSSADRHLKMDMFANFSAREICIANESPVASRLEWSGFIVDGKDDVIKNDKSHTGNGVTWPAHEVNIGQFFSITDQGLLFKEQSIGITLQQKLDPMSQLEIHQLFTQYFTRLTMISGTGVAYKDGRQALQQAAAQLAAAQVAAAALAAAPLPASIAPPSITIASVPSAQLAIASPGMSPGKAPIAAPMPAPAPMIPLVQFPMPVGHKYSGAAASSSSSSSSSRQAMQQSQQLGLLPPAPPPVPSPNAMPCSSMQPAQHPSAGVFGAAAAASPSWSSSSHVQVQSDPNQLPAHLAHLQPEKNAWDDVWAARAKIQKQLQQQQQ